MTIYEYNYGTPNLIFRDHQQQQFCCMKHDPAKIWSSIVNQRNNLTNTKHKASHKENYSWTTRKNKETLPPHGRKHNYSCIILRHVAVILTFPGHCPVSSLISLYQTTATKLSNYTWLWLGALVLVNDGISCPVSNELPKGSLEVKISMLLSQKIIYKMVLLYKQITNISSQKLKIQKPILLHFEIHQQHKLKTSS